MALGVFKGTAATGETVVVDALKQHYKKERIKEMVYKNNPLLALMPKYESFGGENLSVPIIVGGPQRRSATFSNGQADNSSTSNVKKFLLERVRDYSFASITHEAIRASQGNADAFVRYATMEIDGAIHALKRSIAVAMYRDGSGAIGQQSTTASDPQGAKLITLENPEDISNFEVGMKIVFAESKTGALLSNVGTKEIDSVDRSAGTFTVKVNLHNDADAGDYIFQLGDAHAGVDFKKIRGLEAWCPASAPSSASFFGVDRTSDVTRLGGNRYDGSALPIEEALIEGLSLCARNGGTPSHVFMHYKNYAQLEKALGSKVQYDKVSSSDSSVGFTSMKIHGPAGTVDVIPDVNCQADVAWGLQLDTWSLNSLGAAPQILDLDSNKLLRESTADAYEVRCGAYMQIGCTAPGWNVRIAL
tara:strand:+ start:8433 stop:9686 length:1254 start_codon:yes stop_codon:yes gene_type:complete